MKQESEIASQLTFRDDKGKNKKKIKQLNLKGLIKINTIFTYSKNLSNLCKKDWLLFDSDFLSTQMITPQEKKHAAHFLR